MAKHLFPALLLALLVIGCSDGRNTASLGGAKAAVGQLYVSTNTSILRFNNALQVTGNATPAATISGAATTLAGPDNILVDPSNNRLFIANRGGSSILVYDTASVVNGNAAPSRTISGSSTNLSAPHALALDTTSDLLYVGDGNQILVFQGASSASGNVPPVHNISMGFAVGGMFVDVPNNRLFVASSGGNSIARLESANQQNGNAVISASIIGPATLLSFPHGLALDSSGRLVVGNSSGNSITIYATPSVAIGNVAPAAAITGSATQLNGPGQIVFSSTQNNGELYVANNLAGSVVVFSNVTAANGNVAPSRTIFGSSTGLVVNGVNGVALDPTR